MLMGISVHCVWSLMYDVRNSYLDIRFGWQHPSHGDCSTQIETSEYRLHCMHALARKLQELQESAIMTEIGDAWI